MKQIINPALVPIEAVPPGTVGLAYSAAGSPMARREAGGASVAMAAIGHGTGEPSGGQRGVFINDSAFGGGSRFFPDFAFPEADGFRWTHFLPLAPMLIDSPSLTVINARKMMEEAAWVELTSSSDGYCEDRGQIAVWKGARGYCSKLRIAGDKIEELIVVFDLDGQPVEVTFSDGDPEPQFPFIQVPGQ